MTQLQTTGKSLQITRFKIENILKSKITFLIYCKYIEIFLNGSTTIIKLLQTIINNSECINKCF